MKKNLVLFVFTLICMTVLINPGFSNVPPNGSGSGSGGSGGGNNYTYVTRYESITSVLQENGYSTNYLTKFISASAISPNGTCTVRRVHTPILKITIKTYDNSSDIHYDLFCKFLINGKVKELRVVR